MTDFDELHAELRAVARDVLDRPTVDWRQLVDAGWPGLEVADEMGGAGATFVETAIVLEEIGRAAATTGYLGCALAVAALNAASAADARDDVASRIAAGDTAALATGFEMHGDGTLSGRAEFVPDAAAADHLLLLARDDEGAHVLATAAVTVTPQPVVDETRALAVVTADRATPLNAWPIEGDAEALHERAAVAVACDSLGLAEAMLARTVDYAKVRHQFGRPIGSFQAVKHACADMLVHIAVAREVVEVAVAEVAAGNGAAVSSAMAKSHATSMAVDVAGKAMQLHGGIGYTWESGIHVYLKRAALNRSLYGSPSAHRRALARRYGV
ncbi:acyl-CoA dehydrogenase [Mycolicibacterium arabiense]|uniref:Acyl-CoA dehydrogenase n=1 Tax=Mycolicibacterium arabiense TaxID=1286181 RepID=A0A7I7S634_9MYCO|nr:acyl-CoA dehydrogenase family protein [Mycolicibacterium arabiense]BBY52268.1 acyl-CoA dehydrogenase [Mycolicibacterium arabiense]